MRQRNDLDHELIVHTIPPQTMQPGDVIDWDDPVIGLTPLEDEPEPEPAEQSAEQPARRAGSPDRADGRLDRPSGRSRTTTRTADQAQEG